MKAVVLTSPNTVVYLAVVSIMWCFLSKQNICLCPKEFKDPLKLWVVEMVVLSARLVFTLGTTLLPNCDYCCGLRLLRKKKMLILEVGVELPMFYDNERAYRFLAHLEWNGQNFPYTQIHLFLYGRTFRIPTPPVYLCIHGKKSPI